MTQNVEQLGTSLGYAEIVDTRPDRPRGLRGRPQVAQPVAARVAQVPQAPAGADRAGRSSRPDRCVAVIGPVLLPFSFTDIPKPDQIVGRRRSARSTPPITCARTRWARPAASSATC